ncbi:hypothetical protein HY480_03360 [Candidatus Uhrbacteria bacterium]|nr:hypothetical protein [Candidatus Uhrbacteria bacterium]
MSDSHGGDGTGELHPYFFHRDSTDVLREAFGTLLSSRAEPTARKPSAETDEETVILEQRHMLFAHDAPMQQLFDGDFDAFAQALDEPWRFDERLRRRRSTVPPHAPSVEHGEGEHAQTRLWEFHGDDAHEHAHAHAHEHGPSESDPVYDRAFQWACRIERWGRRVYVAQKDRDCYRAFANVTLVPAKIAFASSASSDNDVAGFTTALIGYRQAWIFCLRVLESLGSCYARRVGRGQTVHEFLDEGRDLLADIESRIAEVESELRFRKGNTE